MKRIICLLLTFAMMLSLLACGGAAKTEDNTTEDLTTDKIVEESNEVLGVVDNRTETISEGVIDNRTSAPENVTFTDDEFEITAEYLYDSTFATMYYVAVKNNSGAVVSVSGNGIAKDASGNMLGAADMSIDVLGPGEESIGYFFFSGVEGIETIDYELTYSAEKYYYPVISNLSMEQVLNDQNVTVKVTNNGDVNAQFVQAYGIFVDSNNKVLYAGSTYITDDDSEIKVGATISAQIDAYQQYDKVFVYLTGRSDGTSTVAGEGSVDPSNFEVKEYLYNSSFGSQDFLIIRNNSSTPVKVSGNATGYDALNNVVGAADMSIDILGANEESIGYFYFMGVNNLDHVEYELTYSDDTYYSPVITDLEIEQTWNDKNVIVSVTNNGTKPAEFVQAHAIFFNSNNEVVYYNSTYITDDDSEIKPGKTIVDQLNCYEPYDHVEIYLTGRAH